MNDDMIQVVMEGPVRQAFEAWLRSRGAWIYRMPINDPDDLPTYGITLSDADRRTTGGEET